MRNDASDKAMSDPQPIMFRGRWRAVVCALGLVLAAGCGHTPVNFVLNREGQKPRKQLPSDQQELRLTHDEAIADILYAMFGTPDDPVAWGGAAVSGLDERKLRLAAGAAD